MKVYILVGLPGSGKSTTAKVLQDACDFIGESCEILSTDDYFDDGTGYKFDPDKVATYHKWNREEFEECLQDEVEVVIVDNTNLFRVHREFYATKAREYGYEVHYRVIGEWDEQSVREYFHRGLHSVPLRTIFRMVRNYQEVSDEEIFNGTNP